MAVIELPPEIQIREDSWTQSDPRIDQVSDFTGTGRDLLVGPAAKWRCAADIPTRTTDQLRAVRAFLAKMAIPGNVARLDIGPAAQGGQQISLPGATADGRVLGAGQMGRTLAIHTLAPSRTHLRAGDLMSFGFWQTVTLTADLVANGSGVATAEFDQPIRVPPLDFSVVLLRFPVVHMRLEAPMAWRDLLANLHEIPTLNFVERF